MKVSEAKEKVCPFIYNMQSSALGESEGMHINCICGDCMAWVYAKEYKMKDGTLCDNSYASAFINDDTHKENFIELDEDEKEGNCKRLTE